MKSRTKGVLIAVAFIGAFACLTRLTGCLNVGMPRRVRLADVSATKTAVSFIFPRGDVHQIVYDIPKDGSVPSGRLAVCGDGKMLAQTAICPQNIQACNWLHEESKGKTYILTRGLTKGQTPLHDLLTPGYKYRVELILDEPPLDGSSLWLTWVQAVNVFAQSLAPRSQEQIDRSVQPSPAGVAVTRAEDDAASGAPEE